MDVIFGDPWVPLSGSPGTKLLPLSADAKLGR